MLGPRPHRRVTAQAGRRRLGEGLRRGGRAMVSLRRHLLRAVRNHAACRARGHGGREEAWDGHLLRFELPRVVMKGVGGTARAQEVNRDLASLVEVMIGNE